MNVYYSATQVNQKNWELFQDKPMADEWSRKIVIKLLEQFCGDKYKSIYASKGNCCYDLKLTMNNKSHTALEIKFRSERSDRYPSHLINKEKWDGLVKKYNNRIIQDAYVITIWSDGVIHISNAFRNYTMEQHWQNQTTNVSGKTDGKKVLKDCMCYKAETVFYLAYEADPETAELEPILSRQPINVAQLNEDAQKIKCIPLF